MDNIEEKKTSIFSKISNFIKRFFKPKQALPAPETVDDLESSAENISAEETTTSEAKKEFMAEIKAEPKEENPELLDLQQKFESNQIQLTQLSDEELLNLNNLYERQIDDLKKKLDNTKTEISMASYSAS